jgi:hypothetical protein
MKIVSICAILFSLIISVITRRSFRKLHMATQFKGCLDDDSSGVSCNPVCHQYRPKLCFLGTGTFKQREEKNGRKGALCHCSMPPHDYFLD